jgi:hypothetical protein
MERIIRLIFCVLCFLSLAAASYDVNSLQKLSGTFEVLISDNFKTGVSNKEYYLDVKQSDNTVKSVPMHFSKDPNLQTGSKVEIMGTYQEDGSFNVKQWDLIEAAKAAPMGTTKVRKVLYVILNLADVAVVETPTQITPVIVNSSPWIETASFNNLSLPTDSNGDGQVDLVGPITISSTTANGCQPMTWANNAVTVLQSMGIDTTAYQHLFFMLPPPLKTKCAWDGLGQLGCGDHCFAWSEANLSQFVHVHELGHNFGFNHASNDPDNNLVINDVYGDGSCPMGNIIPHGYYNAPHQRQLNWLSEAAGDITRIPGNGSYTLVPMSRLPLGGTRVLLADRDTNNDYILSYRPTTTFDKPAFGAGINIYTMHKNMTGNTLWVNTILSGQSFSTTNLRVDVGQVDANGNMPLNVLTSCFENPILTVTPQYSVVNMMTPASYSVSVKNPQQTNCPSINVALSPVAPSNLAVHIPTPNFVLAPGQEFDQEFTVTATNSTNGWNTITLNANASNGTSSYKGYVKAVKQIFVGRDMPNFVNGLNLAHYAGSWHMLPDFTYLTPNLTKIISQVRNTDYTGKSFYGLRFEGFIQIRSSGDHYFYLNSDDGSSFTLNGVKVINNDGVHGSSEVQAMVTLEPGIYPFTIDYFNADYLSALTFSHMEPNSQSKLEVPMTDLLHYDSVAASTQPPVVNAGPDLTANVSSTLTINGSATNPNNTITGYTWTKISGPSVTWVNQNKPSVTLKNLIFGSYVFRLTATNSYGESGSDDMALTVK